MSNENKSDLQKAAEQVDANQVKENLAQDKPSDTPEKLSEDEKTPFMDNESRTDKWFLSNQISIWMKEGEFDLVR